MNYENHQVIYSENLILERLRFAFDEKKGIDVSKRKRSKQLERNSYRFKCMFAYIG